jgi:predicted MFS family arabinose efflux permease
LVEPGRKGRALALTLDGMSSGTVIGMSDSLWIADRLGWQCVLGTVAILLRVRRVATG